MHPNKTRLYIIRIIIVYCMVVYYIHSRRYINYGYFSRWSLKSASRADTIGIIFKKTHYYTTKLFSDHDFLNRKTKQQR